MSRHRGLGGLELGSDFRNITVVFRYQEIMRLSRSLLRARRRRETPGWSNPIARILSLRIVRLFGVPRSRPPRRSPGLEPRSMFHSPGAPGSAARVGRWPLSRARAVESAPLAC